jgi:hypothetical protein
MKAPSEKMRMKPGMSAALLHVPEDLSERLGIPSDVRVLHDPAEADFILDFATTQAEAEERLVALRPAVGARTIAWLGYPKGSRAAGHDISRDTLFAFVGSIGLTLVANVAIDDTWSAVRLRPQSREQG